MSEKKTYVEISQFLWGWALAGSGKLDEDIIAQATRVSDRPFGAAFGHVVLVAGEDGKLGVFDQSNVDSSG